MMKSDLGRRFPGMNIQTTSNMLDDGNRMVKKFSLKLVFQRFLVVLYCGTIDELSLMLRLVHLTFRISKFLNV